MEKSRCQNTQVFLKGIFLTGCILLGVTTSFSAACGNLDSVASSRISSPLCDTLISLDDSDYAKIEIFIKQPTPLPPSPPRGADSAKVQYWIDSVYHPWVQVTQRIVSVEIDSLLSNYDIRELNDTGKRMLETPDSGYSSINCIAKKSTVMEIAKVTYIQKIQNFYQPYPIRTVNNKQVQSSEFKILAQEYFTIDGKRVSLKNINRNNHSRGILIISQKLSDGRVIYKRSSTKGL